MPGRRCPRNPRNDEGDLSGRLEAGGAIHHGDRPMICGGEARRHFGPWLTTFPFEFSLKSPAFSLFSCSMVSRILANPAARNRTLISAVLASATYVQSAAKGKIG